MFVYLQKNIHAGAIAASILLSVLIITLVVTGGQENTGLHWVYPLLFVQFILLSAYRGLIHSLVLLGILAAILAKPELVPADYSSTEISRALTAIATLVLLCFVSEYFRQRSHLDISSQHTAKMVEAATDPLTGLTNRRFLDAFYFPDCKRDADRHFPLTVIVCDLDQFKTINDELGHSVGDTVLQHVARTLSESIRNNDVVSRIGGEEFLVLAERTALKVSTAIAEKLRGKIERMGIRELNHGITSSFGVAVCQRFDQLNQTIELADQRMYEAKKQGRNCVVGG
ncbi:MAG: diguanylate cyclase (GGDEF)-like protein [Bermanella sp.]